MNPFCEYVFVKYSYMLENFVIGYFHNSWYKTDFLMIRFIDFTNFRYFNCKWLQNYLLTCTS